MCTHQNPAPGKPSHAHTPLNTPVHEQHTTHLLGTNFGTRGSRTFSLDRNSPSLARTSACRATAARGHIPQANCAIGTT